MHKGAFMVQRFAKVPGIVLAIFGIVWIAPWLSFGSESPFLLPADKDSIFREEGLTSTRYFHFEKNGKYRMIVREHLFTAEMDRGTWKQDANGEIELCSSIRLKELKKGPLRIDVRDKENFEALRPLEKDIERFLDADKSDSWPREVIQSAWKYPYIRSLFNDTISLGALSVEKGVDKITRIQLVELLEAWKAYLKDDTRNRFHITPVRYETFVLLASGDHPLVSSAKTPDQVKKKASGFKDSNHPEKPPIMVYVLVDQEDILDEMKKKHPFLFYPAMTQGGEEVLTYK